jgi:hypothetical protein
MNRFIQSMLWLPLAAALFAAATLPQTVAAGVRYVKPLPSGAADGSSWADASGDLQAMINASSDPDDEVWVYEGTYKPVYTANGWNGSAPYPDTDGTRDNAFVLKAGVKIYGGFTSEVTGTAPAFGTAGRDGTSTLSGDLDDTGNWSSGDAYHVVIGADIPGDGATVLDGFTVSGGNADGGSDITVNSKTVPQNNGGGIHNYYSSPVLTDVIISENKATISGGGMYNSYLSSPVLTRVTIRGNTSERFGGGIFNINDSSPQLTSVTVSGNQAFNVGGIHN